MNNVIDLSLLNQVNIATQLDTGYQLYVANHNEKVKKIDKFLSKIIDCVKFCKYELPLKGHDESSSSHNPGVFRGLINFISKFDLELYSQISSCTIFKGLSKTVQNDILESILHVCKQNIAK